MVGVDQVEPVLGARHAHVGKPPLLLQLALVLERAPMRQQALLHPDDEDDRELQPLGGVERDQGHPVGQLVELVLVADQRHLLQEAGEALRRGDLVELGGVVAQLEDVGPALLAVIGPVLDGRLQAGALERRVEDRRGRLGGGHGHQPAHEIGEARPAGRARAAPGSGSGRPARPRCTG